MLDVTRRSSLKESGELQQEGKPLEAFFSFVCLKTFRGQTSPQGDIPGNPAVLICIGRKLSLKSYLGWVEEFYLFCDTILVVTVHSPVKM